MEKSSALLSHDTGADAAAPLADRHRCGFLGGRRGARTDTNCIIATFSRDRGLAAIGGVKEVERIEVVFLGRAIAKSV